MGLRVKISILIITLLTALVPIVVRAETNNTILITVIKLGGAIPNQPTEFVEIYNDSDNEIDLANWRLEYAKPAAKLTDCTVVSWKQVDSTNVKEALLDGILAPQDRKVVEIPMNDNTGGSLRLRSDSAVIDVVGWGSATSLPLCAEGEPAAIPPNTKSLKRWFDSAGYAIDTNNNLEDFTLEDSPIKSDDPTENPTDDVCNNLEGVQATVPAGYQQQGDACFLVNTPVLPCEALEITEIVPNPSGTDTGNEYVELYNPLASSVVLDGCSLKIGSSTKQLSGSMQPGYQAFYGLVLPNASGGTVELIGATTEKAVTYPADLSDDEAWAYIGSSWQLTTTPTPSKANVATATVTTANTKNEALEPCPEGKFRNPETNRCKNIETDDGLKPCEPGQVRNPETNRCRKLDADGLTSLKPCSPGQERNPATNRCRKVATSSSSLKACEPGQERNPETNRCRKVAGASTASTSSKEQAQNNAQPVGYAIFGLLAVAGLGYGAYEYRQEIGNFFSGLRLKLKK